MAQKQCELVKDITKNEKRMSTQETLKTTTLQEMMKNSQEFINLSHEMRKLKCKAVEDKDLIDELIRNAEDLLNLSEMTFKPNKKREILAETGDSPLKILIK